MQSQSYKYAISTKNDGSMSYMWGDYEEVLENRRKFIERAGFSFDRCITMKTSDGDTVLIVSKQDTGRGMIHIEEAFRADALITSESDLSLFLVVADCVATIFYDELNKVLCLAHLNGKNPKLINSVISKLREKYATNVADLSVYMSPAIHKESFIVPDPFQRDSQEWKDYIVNLDEHLTSIDMIGFLREKIIEQGVNPNKIAISDTDTYCDTDYFSHRRSVTTGEPEGRFAMVAKMIK